MQYTVDATVTISLENVRLRLDEPIKEKLDLEDALVQFLNKRLTLLDIKGARSGDDGLITSIACEDVDNWVAD